jgi:hypothetical protein
MAKKGKEHLPKNTPLCFGQPLKAPVFIPVLGVFYNSRFETPKKYEKAL